MINPHQFVTLILEPALKACGLYSIDAMYLMTCTALVESKLTHLKQLPEGPALGLFQIEPITYRDCVRYLYERNTSLLVKILGYIERDKFPDNPGILISDMALNVLIARVKYWMQPERLPSYKDPASQAKYYELYYQCNPSIDKTQEFIRYAKDIESWIQIPTSDV